MSIGRSLFSRIFSSHAVTVLLFAALSLVLSLGAIKTYFLNQEAAELKNSALITITNIEPAFLNKNFKAVESIIKRVGKKTRIRITIINADGKVIADSEKNKNLIENHSDKPEIISALKGKIGRKVRFSMSLNKKLFYVAIPIKKHNKVVGVLRVSHPLKSIKFLIDDFEIQIVQITLIALSLSLLLSFIFSKNIAFDLKNLANGAKKVASGKFDTQIRTKNRGEIKILADSFNYMANQIKRLFGEVSSQKNELVTIIGTIADAIVVLKDDKIEIANSSFLKLAGHNDLIGRSYWELAGDKNINEAIEKILSDKKRKYTELKIGEEIYNYATAILPDKKMMIILHDITSIKNLEQVKNDFVANVSHELRTPLAAIKGFTETLKDEEQNADKLHYLKIIEKHTDRLTNIVADLLILSQIEDKTASISTESVDIKEGLDNIVKLFRDKASKKGISIETKVDNDLRVVNLDSYKFDQLMINLIDNAVKYTNKGKIVISMTRETDGTKIIVEDTGIGIPKNEIERVFERFYRVDRSRSKTAEGTGLGLSIVKHIILLFGGTVALQSKLGKGTKFILKLPEID